MEVAEEKLTEFFSTMLAAARRASAEAAGRRRCQDARSWGSVGRGAGGGSQPQHRDERSSKTSLRTGRRFAGRVRSEGAGRKRNIDKDPDLLLVLDELVSPEARGDPMSPLRWTNKSTYHLSRALAAKGYGASPSTVRRAACTRWAIACKAPRSRKRAPSTWTETPNFATSTTPPACS